jgi:hypothetical protein
MTAQRRPGPALSGVQQSRVREATLAGIGGRITRRQLTDDAGAGNHDKSVNQPGHR